MTGRPRLRTIWRYLREGWATQWTGSEDGRLGRRSRVRTHIRRAAGCGSGGDDDPSDRGFPRPSSEDVETPSANDIERSSDDDFGGVTEEEIAQAVEDCANGEFSICDLLFQSMPSGSEEEAFGATCGNRVDTYDFAGGCEQAAADAQAAADGQSSDPEYPDPGEQIETYLGGDVVYP